MPLEIVTIPCRTDNYAYLLHDPVTGATAVVDVPEVGPIRKSLADRGWSLSDILITHHHTDHVEGVKELKSETGARVIGAAADAHRLPPLDVKVAEGDTVKVGDVEGQVLDVSGHTMGHIAFVFPGAAFTADSLMALGCGRIFEGDPETMWTSLSKLAALPPETMIYSGHEYTEANGRFALTVDPDNQALKERMTDVREARAEGRPTVPSLLEQEIATNPFLRARTDEMKARLGMAGASDAKVFGEIRRRKDAF
ncbi:hydroxyacylglutathione hydrolase [Tropicimonas isoalkanivorans]|uniref:Hydroxyacylglutathione hydrolase n=1 Tax=Tropicimonas isoalkanivorans TaxID=441112 RepID=A0A1I1Q4C1_9RHOB|nr:hydroxyacylglutathione hydrolase [Tropicimonas isoalkanivorans]SFD12990.1 hydroxyacylglutathione hydrolase [Tropicimonas isoalkanivorans]